MSVLLVLFFPTRLERAYTVAPHDGIEHLIMVLFAILFGINQLKHCSVSLSFSRRREVTYLYFEILRMCEYKKKNIEINGISKINTRASISLCPRNHQADLARISIQFNSIALFQAQQGAYKYASYMTI